MIMIMIIIMLLYYLCLLVHLSRHAQVSQRLSGDILVVFFLFFFWTLQPLFNESSKSRYLEFSTDVISLSRSRAIAKIALSRTFCPVPSEFEITGLDCINKNNIFLTFYWFIKDDYSPSEDFILVDCGVLCIENIAKL